VEGCEFRLATWQIPVSWQWSATSAFMQVHNLIFFALLAKLLWPRGLALGDWAKFWQIPGSKRVRCKFLSGKELVTVFCEPVG
jgi:hypothetical protein